MRVVRCLFCRQDAGSTLSLRRLHFLIAEHEHQVALKSGSSQVAFQVRRLHFAKHRTGAFKPEDDPVHRQLDHHTSDVLSMAAVKRICQSKDGRQPLDDALNAHHNARRWHLGLYQAMSAAFTPQYQSDSRLLPRLRDHILSPMSRLWPLPRILTALVSGDLLPPIAGTRFPDA